MNDTLKEILEGDYKFVLISGDYFDCPSCNNSTSFQTDTFWDEKALLEHIMKRVGADRMEAIWVLDSDNGDMAKFSEIDTKAGFHRVLKLEFDLPSGHIVIEMNNGKYELLSPAGTLLYGNANTTKT